MVSWRGITELLFNDLGAMIIDDQTRQQSKCDQKRKDNQDQAESMRSQNERAADNAHDHSRSGAGVVKRASSEIEQAAGNSQKRSSRLKHQSTGRCAEQRESQQRQQGAQLQRSPALALELLRAAGGVMAMRMRANLQRQIPFT